MNMPQRLRSCNAQGMAPKYMIVITLITSQSSKTSRPLSLKLNCIFFNMCTKYMQSLEYNFLSIINVDELSVFVCLF